MARCDVQRIIEYIFHINDKYDKNLSIFDNVI